MWYISFVAILQDSMIICTPHLYSTNDSNISNDDDTYQKMMMILIMIINGDS